MAQTSISNGPAVAYEGMLATTERSRAIGNLSDFINGGVVALPVGRVVVRKAGATGELTLPSAAGQVVLGVTFADVFNIQTTELNLIGNVEPGYPVGALVPFYKQAVGWMWAEGAVSYGSPVYFRHTAAAAPNDKTGRVAAAASANHDLLPSAVFRSTTTGAGLAIIEFSLP